MPSSEIYTFGSETGILFAFSFFAVFVTLIGWVIYSLLVYPEHRRPQFRMWKAVPRMHAFLWCAAISIAIFFFIYYSMLDGFHRLEITNDNTVQLLYLFPKRTLVMNTDDISNIALQPTYRSRSRLLLYTTDGKLYRSNQEITRLVRGATQLLSTKLQLQNRPQKGKASDR